MRFHRPVALTTRPRVSVVIPCYNYGHYLSDAVASALDQEGIDVDVLIVDDASTDDSADVARRLVDGDPRIDLLVHEANRGHIQTYNDGLAKVSGDYVILLSADDLLVRNALSRAVSLMEHHPGVGMVYGHAESFSGTPPDMDGPTRSWTVWDGRSWLTRMCRHSRNPVYTPSVVMRHATWNEVGPYDGRVPHGADMLLWYRTATRWDIGRVNNSAQALYRVHGNNMHATVFAGQIRDMREQQEIVRILFSEPPAGTSLPASLQAAANRALGRRAARLASVAARDSADAATVAEYTEFARAAGRAGGASGAGIRVAGWLGTPNAAFPRKVKEHVEWRLWRRYGL